MEIQITVINNNHTDYKNINLIKKMLKNKSIEVKQMEYRSSDILCNLHITIEKIYEVYEIAKILMDVYETCGRSEGIKFIINCFTDNLLIKEPDSKEGIFNELKKIYKIT